MAEEHDVTLKQPEHEVIGKASATERDPNSSEKFAFWLGPERIVNPFDIVEADQMEGTRTFGLVTNVKQVTDAPSHLSNYISSDFGNTDTVPQTPRQGANVAEVNVLANCDPSQKYPMGIYMPVQSEAPVRFADEEGIHIALGIDKMPEDKRIPAGLIRMSCSSNERPTIGHSGFKARPVANGCTGHIARAKVLARRSCSTSFDPKLVRQSTMQI